MLKRRFAHSEPEKWSKADEKRLLSFIKKNEFSSKKLIELFPERTLPAIRSKVRKLRIKHDLFGESYRDTKTDFTDKIAQLAKPKIVFDAYAGAGHQAFQWIKVADVVYAAENVSLKYKQFSNSACLHGFRELKMKGNWHVFKKSKKYVYLYIGDTISAAAELKTKKISIDLIDLDTCGSTLPTLPFFLLMLKPKHLVITHGEFHSMRFKREDVLRRILVHRDVNKNPLPLSSDKMAIELDKAVKLSALRAHNETIDSFWLNLEDEVWLGGKFHGMLRRYYKVIKPLATSDSLNDISKL